MSDLNLLPSQAKFQAERIRLKKMINNFMWLSGGAWLILVIIVLTINLLKQLNFNQLKKKHQTAADQYKSLIGEISVSQRVKQQAKIVATVLDNRFEYGNSMEKVKNLFSEKVLVDNFDINDSKSYKIKASIPELANLDEVEMKIDDINQGRVEGFKSATLENLTIDNLKGWTFTMEVVLL